ncbi:MAG: molecular chaperone DnaJ [Candidatus Peribacteraceae bacterium]|nr:molecular chaperone DnaJ [Candidatus Peribacteraceae bacterium]
MAKDYYGVLGLQKGASAEEVKKAYRRLSKELHPDKHKGGKDAEKRFKEVNEAYEVLSNPQKKQMYDQFGEAGVNGGAAGQGGFGGFDFSGAGGADAFSDLFEGFFGGGRRQAAARQEGNDLEVEIAIDLSEVVTGVRRDVRIRRNIACDRCGGNGAEPGTKLDTCGECGGTGQVTRTAQSFFGVIQQRTVCPRCRGSGKVPEKPCTKCDGEGRVASAEEVQVDVPPGIDDGQALRLRGQGEAGRRGATAGDLYVRVRVRPDDRFVREGADIRTVLDVPALDAILGATVDVETVQGNVSLKIPEGTQPGQVLRLKGKGLPVLNTSRFGDHFVTVNVKVPTRLGREERRILEEWRRARG